MAYSENPPKPSSGPAQGPSIPQQPREPPPYSGPPVYTQAQPSVEYAIIMPRPGAGYRFLSAFTVATVIWVLLSMLVQTSVYALHPRRRHQTSDGDYLVPIGAHTDKCIEGSDWKSTDSSVFQDNLATNFRATGQTSFTLPISSAALFFVSRGRNLGGSIDVVTSPSQAADSVTVQVVVSSTNADALGHTRACLLTRGYNENGVGIFTPMSSSQIFLANWNSNFHITVVLPEVGGRAPLNINDFETDLPNSSHQIDDLNEKVLFKKLSLSGSNGPIAVMSLTANTGEISTSNGPITGVFNTTQTLTLSTSNSPITVDVGLTSTGINTEPTLKVVTNNGALTAQVSLISSSGSQGSFSVTARTSNQRLQVSFPTSPVGSQLVLDASTSNSPASVSLDPLYTGGLNLQTSAFADATVNNVHQELTERQVHVSNIGKGSTSGEVFWQSGPNANGMVSVSTSNGPVLLQV